MKRASQLALSFELFPPNSDEGFVALKQTVKQLVIFNPDFFSVTCGAGGGNQDKTFAVVEWLVSNGITVAPHLPCIGLSKQHIVEILNTYQKLGIKHLVTIRGDLPQDNISHDGAFQNANELVAFIREQSGNYFQINVAAYPEFHPQAQDALVDLECFKRKVDAGSNRAITQYFFCSAAYYWFVEGCKKKGIEIPIIPGIMPISDYQKLLRFSSVCQAQIPIWLHKRMQAYSNHPEIILEYGIEVVTQLCQELIHYGVHGLHFYTLNRAEPVATILKKLQKFEAIKEHVGS